MGEISGRVAELFDIGAEDLCLENRFPNNSNNRPGVNVPSSGRAHPCGQVG
jgi:hypothetical protein